MIQVNHLQCFQLDLKVIGHFELTRLKHDGVEKHFMIPNIESMKLIKVEPDVLSKTFEVFIYAALKSSAKVMVEDILECVANGTCNIYIYPAIASNPQINGNELVLTMDAELQPASKPCP